VASSSRAQAPPHSRSVDGRIRPRPGSDQASSSRRQPVGIGPYAPLDNPADKLVAPCRGSRLDRAMRTAPRCLIVRGGFVGIASERSVPRVLCRAVTLLLGEHEASMGNDDALAEVSMIHESADTERSWMRDREPAPPRSRPRLPHRADAPFPSGHDGVDTVIVAA
jgi:hypothetical protein